MPVNNRKAHIGKTMTVKPCDGCGRTLPKGSKVMMWRLWINGFQRKVRLCSDCQDVIYGCDREVNGMRMKDDEEHMVREMCGRCDSYPVCQKVKYLKESKPGDVWFGDWDEVQPGDKG